MATDDELPLIVETVKKSKSTRLKRASDDECEATTEALFETYPGLVTRSIHWSLTLVSILHRIGYSPHRHLCANPKSLPDFMDDLGVMEIVQKRLTDPMLKDIVVAVERWVAERDPETTLTMTDEAGDPVEGAIIIGDGGVMAYRDAPPIQPERSASEEKEDWGSW